VGKSFPEVDGVDKKNGRSVRSAKFRLVPQLPTTPLGFGSANSPQTSGITGNRISLSPAVFDKGSVTLGENEGRLEAIVTSTLRSPTNRHLGTLKL
jgi:hypothetical protein